MKNLVLFLYSLFICNCCFAQLVNNRSFEGPNRPNRPPSFWYPCSPESTPDTQPSAYGVSLPASDGNTYIGLVTRALDFEPFEVREDMETRMNLPLLPGFPYLLSVNLAHAADMGYDDNGTYVEVNRAIRLTVYAGTATCQRDELLWQSPVIENEDWAAFEEVIRPQTEEMRYLVFEATPVGTRTTNGNVLIDNFNLIEEPLVVPNAFTPNNDGINDLFFIKGLKPQSSLKVYSRDGDRTFASDDYQNDWNGADWPAGVYYYTLHNKVKGITWNGEVSIMR